MTTPSTLAIDVTNAPFHRQTHLGKDSYQHIQSLNTLNSIIYGDVLYYSFTFHSEKAQPRMNGLKLKKELLQSFGIIVSEK